MEGRKLKDHIIQLYQSIKQVLLHEERQYLYKSLRDYKKCHDVDQLALQLCKLCTTPDRVEIIRRVWTEIIHGKLSEFDHIMKEYPAEILQNNQILLKVDNLTRHSDVRSKSGKLFDEDIPRGQTHIIKIHRSGEDNLGFCIRGGLEHGLGIYVSGIEEDSVADQGGLQIGDKILEFNNISLHRLPSSSAIKVLTGSNQSKVIVERTGRIPEWRLSRERTVWYDCQTRKLTHGDYEEYGSANYFRGIDVDIPERCITLSNVTDDEELGFNIRGGNEYRLGIYVSKVNKDSKAAMNGIEVGDLVIDVNGIPFDNISHAHAVEILREHTHLMLTLRDVGRYPAYKEIYAEYTWTGTSVSDGSFYGGERLIERKLPDTWIESHSHKKKRNLHLRVPVQVISHHDDKDEMDPLHPEIYLPENDELSHKPGSSWNSDSLSLMDMKPVDTWIGGGKYNPAFQPDEMGDNSSSDFGSGTSGEYVVTMDDIIRQKGENQDQKSALNIYELMINKSQDNLDGGSLKESGRKSVERYIFEDDGTSITGTGSVHSLRLDIKDDDIRSETFSRESLVVDDDEKQNYLSSPTFSSFTKGSQQNGSLTSLADWKKSVESMKVSDLELNNESLKYRESNSDDIYNVFTKNRNDEMSSDDEENFAISVVPGSAFKQKTKVFRYKKKEDSKVQNSRFTPAYIDGARDIKNSEVEHFQYGQGHVTLYDMLSESTDDPGNLSKNDSKLGNNSISVNLHAVGIDRSEYMIDLSGDDLTNKINNLNVNDASRDKQTERRDIVFVDKRAISPTHRYEDVNTDFSVDVNISDTQSEPYEPCSHGDMNSQTELVMHDFDRQIQNLENRKSDLGMYEMSSLNSLEESGSKPEKKERRGSLFNFSRRKSTEMINKQSSWKILKKKIRSGLFKKSSHVPVEPEQKSDFIWSKYNPNTFDEEGMVGLEKSATELFEPDEVISIIRHVKTYHEDHDVERLVDNLLILIDIPEKILLLKDVRQVIYKFDMYRFDELVKQFEIDAYEKLATNVHRELNHDKRRKPKKHILHPETDEFGHFYIKPTKQKDKDQEIQRQVIDIVKNDVDLEPQPQVTLTFSSDDDLSRDDEDYAYVEKYGKDIVVTHVSKQKEMLGLCISGGVECKRQPQIKVDEVLEGGAAADDPRIQPGMIILAIDDTDLRESTHTDAILTLKKAFNNKKNPHMTVVLTDSVIC